MKGFLGTIERVGNKVPHPAIIFLGLHLYHGVWSMLHTLGASNPRYRVLRRTVAPAVAIAITAGYIAIPVAVLAGLVS